MCLFSGARISGTALERGGRDKDDEHRWSDVLGSACKVIISSAYMYNTNDVFFCKLTLGESRIITTIYPILEATCTVRPELGCLVLTVYQA